MTKKVYVFFRFFFAFVLITFLLWASHETAVQTKLVHLVETFGYGGMFLGATLSGFNLVVPIPFIAFISFFVGIGFSFWISIGVIALGMTTGDMLGYMFGNAGGKIFKEQANSKTTKKILGYLEQLKEKHRILPYLALFFYIACIPAPNEIVVVPMAFIGYRLKNVFTTIVLGNFVFNTFAGLFILGVFG
jgi:membrane protein YqaA with SNARE-associated domain